MNQGIKSGRCPKCENRTNHLEAVMIPVANLKWQALSLQCPHCHTIPGVQMNPDQLVDETIAGVTRELKRD
jgi:hypothetical protein